VTPAEQLNAWVQAELDKVGPLTQQQQADLRRVFMPARRMTTHTKAHLPTRAMKRAVRALPPLRLIADRPAVVVPAPRSGTAT
jgi:hypothetical protein